MGDSSNKGKGRADRASHSAAPMARELAVECLIHEMRQPLLGMRAGLGFLGRGLGEKVTTSEDWSILLAQITRMEELFNSYRELVDEAPPEPQVFDAAVVAEQAVELLLHRIQPLGDGFTLELSEDLWPVYGSPNAMLHALVNVIKNALEALLMQPTQGQVAVRVRNTQDGGVEARVSNDGPPPPPELLGRMFEPKVSTKKTPGSGLGLFVARTMLERTGGSIELVAEDDPQRLEWAGTEVVIRLPLPPPDQARGAGPPVARAKARQRALVLDDEEVVLSVVEMALSDLDFEVVTTTAASQAMGMMREERFDLLVTDKNLPDVTGIEVAQVAREIDANMAILLITAYPSRDSADEAMKLDIDAYVNKPFELKDLNEAVQEALARRRTHAIAGQSRRLPLSSHASMIVEIGAAARRDLAMALEGLGFGCRYFRDLRAALEQDPEAALVVVSDAHFGRTDRRLLVEKRKNHPEGRVVILSESDAVDIRVGAILVGARIVLPLPLPPTDELRAALAGALEADGK